MDFLDTLLLFALLTFGIWLLARRRQRSMQTPELAKALRAQGVRLGPVPGYAWIPPKNLDVQRVQALLSEDVPAWKVVSLETFNSPDRMRTVARVTFAEAPERPWLALLELARALQKLSSADAVAVEWLTAAHADAPVRGTLIFSPDRGLWHGGQTGALVLEDLSEGTPLIRAAIPGTPLIPGGGWYLPQAPRLA